MKKIMKRLLVLAMLILAPAFVTYAESGNNTDKTTGSITISNAIAGKTYSAYKILDLESFDTGKGAYTYKVAEGWKDFFDDEKDGAGAAYVTIDDEGYVTWKEGVDEAEAKALAQAALTYATAHTGTIAKNTPTTQEGSTVKFTGLELGYYLVDSSVGALCSLTTTDRNAETTEKNSEPTVDKDIIEDNKLVDSNSVKIGDTVNFQATITVGDGAQSYVLYDKMSTGLTFNGTVTAYLVEKGTTDEVEIDASNYTFAGTATTDYTFKVEFNDSYTKDLEAGDKIIVRYSAVLNKDAVVGSDGNTNTASLTYGDSTDTINKTDSTTTTYTYSVDLVKTDSAGIPLNGATFKLLDANEKEIKLVDLGSCVYRVATASDTTTTTTIQAGCEGSSTGMATISGLGNGVYYFEEITAPNGYNKLAEPVEFTVNNANIEASLTLDENLGWIWENAIQIVNLTGAEMPSTGGIGTILFVVIGSIMMIGCGVLLVAKLRISKMNA